jgi:hypothetical protein
VLYIDTILHKMDTMLCYTSKMENGGH